MDVECFFCSRRFWRYYSLNLMVCSVQMLLSFVAEENTKNKACLPL